jgi:hypothetical protein
MRSKQIYPVLALLLSSVLSCTDAFHLFYEEFERVALNNSDCGRYWVYDEGSETLWVWDW